MLDFIKKIFGFPTKDEIEAAKVQHLAQYNGDPLIVNNKLGEPVTMVVEEPKVAAVEQPVKKARKPRTPKAEKAVKEKVAKPAKLVKAPAKRAAKASKKS